MYDAKRAAISALRAPTEPTALPSMKRKDPDRTFQTRFYRVHIHASRNAIKNTSRRTTARPNGCLRAGGGILRDALGRRDKVRTERFDLEGDIDDTELEAGPTGTTNIGLPRRDVSNGISTQAWKGTIDSALEQDTQLVRDDDDEDEEDDWVLSLNNNGRAPKPVGSVRTHSNECPLAGRASVGNEELNAEVELLVGTNPEGPLNENRQVSNISYGDERIQLTVDCNTRTHRQ
ncbi:hypothetical protein F5I97DRAFT_265720 [Phlebopus sp. FC_14]|nr:hypothetical protein F5I97DRAFT_265720 [Phlebopus sp. FC_14]